MNQQQNESNIDSFVTEEGTTITGSDDYSLESESRSDNWYENLSPEDRLRLIEERSLNRRKRRYEQDPEFFTSELTIQGSDDYETFEDFI